MALVLPILRLCLLLLNFYGTFKAMKPSPIGQRSTRNGQRPSARAMQLRKRELKSRLSVWIVWAAFCSLEPPLDNTIGLIIPFYNEIKCTILVFLLLSRSHGAEAIFLHIIHPLVRPYVPAIDQILVTLHSVFDLLTLLFFFPWEYITDWYFRWKWNWPWRRSIEPSDNQNENSGQDPFGEVSMEVQSDMRRRLRPRNESERARLLHANQQTQSIFGEIEEAQARVRARTRNQLAPRNQSQTRPLRRNGDAVSGDVGLRTRRRVLDQPDGTSDVVVDSPPGSRTTGIHHLDPTIIAQLANGPSKVTSLPQSTAPGPETSLHSRNENFVPTPSPSHSGHEIWYPPKSSFEDRERPASPSRDFLRRTPSPVYPPFPSAYLFTPDRSDNPPPPPRTVTPQDIVMPTPRRVSTGAMRHGEVHTVQISELFPGDTAGRESSRQQSNRLSYASDHLKPEDFFQQALESSIQRTDMDVDTETLSTRDDSSASEESMRECGKNGPVQLVDVNEFSASEMGVKRGKAAADRDATIKGKRKAATSLKPVRRSTRARNDDKSAVQRDEFGFSIRLSSVASDSSVTDSIASSSLPASSKSSRATKKKPLARTKPALKPTPEEGLDIDISDEESVRKKRRLKPTRTKSDHSVDGVPAELDNASRTEKTIKKATVVTAKKEVMIPPPEDKHAGVRTSRAKQSVKHPGEVGRRNKNKGLESK